jgi:hypothetical protein
MDSKDINGDDISMSLPSSTISLSNTEQIVFSTFRIEVVTTSLRHEATGFLVQFKLPNGNSAIALVSCRHVLEGAESVQIWIPIERSDGRLLERFADITFQLNGRATCHPDPNIDLAGFIFHHAEKQVLPEGERLFYRAISEQNIPSLDGWEDISIGDDIFVVGCPHGLEDERNRRPLVRKGVIASLPKEHERPHMLIDVPTLEGSSGSPVIIDAHFAFNRPTGEYELRSRFYLVGVVSGGLELQDKEDDGKLLADLHLGRVVRSDKVRELFPAVLAATKLRKSSSA